MLIRGFGVDANAIAFLIARGTVAFGAITDASFLARGIVFGIFRSDAAVFFRIRTDAALPKHYSICGALTGINGGFFGAGVLTLHIADALHSRGIELLTTGNSTGIVAIAVKALNISSF